MRMLGKFLAVGVVAAAHLTTVLAQAKTYKTSAGIFEISPKGGDGNCKALLSGKLVKSFECVYSYTPNVIAHYTNGIGKLADVVVIQESPMGNACNGGPLHVLGIDKSGAFKITDPIDFCGGRDPVIEKRGTKVRITFPAGPPNRGSGYIPSVVWEYSEGVLNEIKEAPNRALQPTR